MPHTSHNSSSAALDTSLAVPAYPLNHADASLIPSVIHSPVDSGLDVSENGTPAASPGATHTNDTTAAEGVGNDGDNENASGEPEVKIDTLPAILGYFGMMFGGGISVFYSQIFREKGFIEYEIGMMVATYPLLSMTLLPVLSYLADKYRCETKMMMVCIVVSTIATIAYTMATVRWLVIAFFLILTAAHMPMNPLLDQRTMMMFPRKGRSSAWSHVRSYGAYGWGFGCLVGSLIYTATKSWAAVSLQYAVGQIGLIYCMVKTKPYEEIEKEPVRFKEVLHLLATNKRIMLFLFAATMMGTGYSFVENFLFLFLDELGGPKALMGFTVVLTVSTEIPLFQMSERLHQMFTERHMICMAMGVWTFRVICYSLLTNPWYVLLIEPLHGFTFAFMWLPAVHLISRAFPPKLSSSATGVLFTFTSGVGPMMGNLIAGTLYTLIGPRRMFVSAATAMASALVFYICMDLLLERRGVPIVIAYDAHAAAPVGAESVSVSTDDGALAQGSDSGKKKESSASASPKRAKSQPQKEAERRPQPAGDEESELPL